MLKQLRSYVHKYMLQKELRFHKPDRQITNIADARDVGILLDATDPDRTNLINQLADSLRTQFRKVHILGFYNYPKPALNLNFQHFHNKQLNWYLEPQGHIVEEFMNRKFDVLINAYTGENLQLEYISALSNAKYRIGVYEPSKTYLSDVLLDTKSPNDLRGFVEQVKHYIYQIR